MDYKKILTGVLSKAFKLDDGKIAELSKDGENELSESEIISKILEIDVERVNTIKSSVDTKSAFQDGFKKAKKEVLDDLETNIKERFQIESEKTGIDLINEVVAKSTENSNSEDAVRRSKTFLDMESNFKNEIKNLKESYQNEVDTIKSVYEGEKVFSAVNKSAMQILNELSPILPTNKAIADNQISAFLEKFKDFNFELQDDRIVVLDKDKKVIQDAHGNTRGFDEIVKEKASTFFEFTSNNGGSGSGNNNGSNGSSGSKVVAPKNLEELTKIMNDDSVDGNEKLLIAEAFEKTNSSQ